MIYGVNSSPLVANCLDREGAGLPPREGEAEGRPNSSTALLVIARWLYKVVIVRTELEGHKEGTGGGGYRLQPGNVFTMRMVKGGKGLPRGSV